MNISLPDSMKEFVELKVSEGGYSTSSEYMRELLRREMEESRFRGLIEEGLASPVEGEFDAAYFNDLRRRIGAKSAAMPGGAKSAASKATAKRTR